MHACVSVAGHGKALLRHKGFETYYVRNKKEKFRVEQSNRFVLQQWRYHVGLFIFTPFGSSQCKYSHITQAEWRHLRTIVEQSPSTSETSLVKPLGICMHTIRCTTPLYPITGIYYPNPDGVHHSTAIHHQSRRENRRKKKPCPSVHLTIS